MRRRTRAAVVALLLIVAVTACGGEDGSREQQSRDERRSTETHETTTAADAETETGATTTGGRDEDPLSGGKSCSNENGGYTVRYPAEWHTNSGDVVAPCRFFHPEPFEVEPHTEVLDLAISIRVEAVPFHRVTGEDPSERRLEQETTLDGRPGVRIEAEATGAALLPEGARVYRYAFDLDGRTLVATTLDVEGLDYEENKRVLDAMVATIDLQ